MRHRSAPACVIKLYTQESDSAIWETCVLEAADGLVSSALMRTEAASAFLQKEERGEILPGAAQALLSLLDNDIAAGRFQVIPVGSDVLNEACIIGSECHRHEPAIFVRTLDGIHLATARLLKCKRVATADARMRAAAGVLAFDLVA